jgi:hypothetical protein
MSRRIRSMICKGAAAALLACAGNAPAEAADEITSLPQWVLRAQERLALSSVQQQELRALSDGNSERLRALQVHYLGNGDAQARRAQRDEMALMQQDFRNHLAVILSSGQLTEWDALLEELLGEVHLRNAPRLAEVH